MFRLGTTELLILLAIVILLFGVGRIGKIAGELGSGIRSFRETLNGPAGKADAENERDSSHRRSS